ncbi:MAG: response regulator, partial [Calditrichaeota bacterium]|nr:response regulator [Calditrichota bacterium]
IKSGSFDLAVVDLMMPEMGGLALLEEIHKIDDKLICIVITGYATIETAVDAVKKGAYDYLPKPFTPDEFRAKIARGLERRRLLLEAEQLRHERDMNLLECSNEKSRTLTILNCLSEGLIATNKKGQIALINPAASKMLHLRTGHIVGKKVTGLLGYPELEKNIIEMMKKTTGKSTLKKMEIETTDGRTVQPNITAILDERDETLGTVTVLIDISEEKKIEKMKSEFVRLVSHELKAPIGAIQGYLNLILDGVIGGDKEKERDILQKTRDKTESLIELIGDLLDLSRTERKLTEREMRMVDVAGIIVENVEFYRNEANEKNISLIMREDSELPPVRGNYEELSRAFANLISNAIKYTLQGGQVEIDVTKTKAHVVIAVKDNGIGMSEEDLSNIFTEFFRGKNAVSKKISGTGLGLAIANRIVEDHNGYIEVKSKLNQGSIFTVVLPVMKQQA